MYKLAAIDLDGTLLDSNGRISPGNKKALLEYEKAGGVITLVSGRSPKDMRGIISELGICGVYHVAMMGNVIFSNKKTYPPSFSFPQEQYEKILSILEDFSVPYLLSGENGIFYKRFNGYNVYEYFTHGAGLCMNYEKNMEKVSNPYRFNIYVPDKKVYEALYEKLSLKGVLKYHSYPNIDLIPQNADKGYAFRSVLYALGLEKKDSMAIGDGAIDCELLASSSFGVALFNAAAELKEKADAVVEKTNDEDGVAYALYEYAMK